MVSLSFWGLQKQDPISSGKGLTHPHLCGPCEGPAP